MQQTCEIYKEDIKDIFKRGVWMLLIPAVSCIYTLLNKETGRETILSIGIDEAIPFLKAFIIPYIMWYPYVAVFLILLCIKDKNGYIKLLMSLLIGMLISYGIFYIFPTHVPRPDINGSDIFSKLTLIVYSSDNPYNCFPSIHVLNSVLVAIFINRSYAVNKTVKIISTITAIGICLSTMFVKQHVFLDVAAGTILAYILYFFIKKLKLYST